MGATDEPEERPHHVSYLLRLWQVEDDGRVTWRASLQSADTGERMGFATLVALLSFLEQKCGAVDSAKANP